MNESFPNSEGRAADEQIIADELRKGETVYLAMKAGQTMFQSLDENAPKYLSIAKKAGVRSISFNVGGTIVIVECK